MEALDARSAVDISLSLDAIHTVEESRINSTGARYYAYLHRYQYLISPNVCFYTSKLKDAEQFYFFKLFMLLFLR